MLVESYALLPPLFCLAGYTEIRYGRIPNYATVTAFFLALGSAFCFHGFDGLCSSLIGAAVGGGVMLPFCLAGALGGGDLKLMTAVGAIVGWPMVFRALYFSALAGGIMALLLLLWKDSLFSTLAQIFRSVFFRKERHENSGLRRRLTLPYGLAIASGTVFSIFREMVQ